MDGAAIAQQIMDARDLAATGQETSALVYFEALLPQLVRRARSVVTAYLEAPPPGYLAGHAHIPAPRAWQAELHAPFCALRRPPTARRSRAQPSTLSIFPPCSLAG